MRVIASSKPKPSPEYLTWPPALNAIKNPLPNPQKKKRSDNLKKGEKKFLGNGSMNSLTTSSFLIAVMPS